MSNLDKIKEKLKKYEETVEGIKKYENAAIYPQQTVKVVPAKTQAEQEAEYYKNNPATFASNLNTNLIQPVGKTVAQFIKTLGADTLDASVDTAEGLKSGFKSQMVQDELKAWNSLAYWQSGEYKNNKRWANFSQDLVNSYIQSAKDTLKYYNVSVPDNVTPEYAKQKAKELEGWVNKENPLEKYTENLSQQVHVENEQLPAISKYIANSGGVVGRMVPSIASNIVIPRKWFAYYDGWSNAIFKRAGTQRRCYIRTGLGIWCCKWFVRISNRNDWWRKNWKSYRNTNII